MRPSTRFLQHASRITLFTRVNCSLCGDAKLVLSRIWEKRPFHYDEVDVMAPGQKRWKDMYEFDTPVIHVEKAATEPGPYTPTVATEIRKLMHRFTEDDVERLMVEGENEV